MSRVIVIGGGAAGMMAAVAAAETGHEVVLLEKNEKLGKKIYITGKGRCNLTNACDRDAFFRNIVSNPKFLYSAYYHMDQEAVMNLMEEEGCPVKTERGDRVFPVSDHASDVIRALHNHMDRMGVAVSLHTAVQEICVRDGAVTGVLTGQKKFLNADAVVLAAGGRSYPTTGSDGDGYRLARSLGHTITEIRPALVPLCIRETWCRELQGLALKNIGIRITGERDGREIFRDFGEMLFTHFGISGPVVLSASSYLACADRQDTYTVHLDLKPALSMEQLDKRLLHDFAGNQNRQFKNTLNGLFPVRMIPVMIHLSGISPEKKINEISREERRIFAERVKDVRMTITGTRGFDEAIVTQGGVSTGEINPSTMESKLVRNLFFAGEIMDVDALTGGFNLQIAWSTGHLAGEKIPWL